jgi:hypothetical protein
MRTALVVARRELREQRAYLVAAAFAALLPLLGPLLAGISRYPANDVRLLAAGIIACTLTVLAAVTLGATVLGRDLADGRIGFYLSRPISSSALWVGKMTAAFALILAMAFIVLAPATVINATMGDQRWAARDVALTLGLLVALGFVLLHLAHAVGVMWCDRSWWPVIDVVLFAGVVYLAWRALHQLMVTFTEAMTIAAVCLAAALALALALAGLVQTMRGRSDLRAGHRWLSLTLWGVLVPATVAAAVYSHWAVTPTPADLRNVIALAAAPRGTWVWVQGEVGGRGNYAFANFAVDTTSTRYVRLGASSSIWAKEAVFTSDGGQALWWEWDGRNAQLMTADLSKPNPVSETTTLTLPGSGGELVLAPGSYRLAILEGKTVSVYALPSLKLLAAARVPGDERSYVQWRWSYFPSKNELRLFLARRDDERAESGTIAILSFDVASRRLQETGRIAQAIGYRRPEVAAGSRDRLLVIQQLDGPSLNWLASLHDGRTGERVAELGTGAASSWAMMRRFLADGRAVVARSKDGQASLHVFSPQGNEERTIPLGNWSTVRSGREVAPGQLVIATGRPAKGETFLRDGGEIVIVDVNAGTVRPLAKGLWPAEFPWWQTLSSVVAREPGSLAAWLFLTRERTLVRLDPATGAQKLILGRQKRS